MQPARDNAIYRISFTWNKPETCVEAEFVQSARRVGQHIKDVCRNSKYVYQLERGELGRLHYQGHIKLHTKERIKAVSSRLREALPGVHTSPSSRVGSTDAEFYCTKDDTRVDGPWGDDDHIFPDYSNIFPPQGVWEEIKEKLDTQSTRHIMWVYDNIGCVGKTNFATYMEINKLAWGLGLGSAKDNYYAVSTMPCRRCYIFDVPRTQGKNFDWGEMYQSIEKIKDRNFLSEKYKCQKVILPIVPKILILANQPPHRAAMSADRWTVFEIINNALVQHF